MKTIKKNVYYCDFCKKKGLSASALSKHEKHCTGNINRVCRMCEGNQPNYQEAVDRLGPRVKQIPESSHPFGDESTALMKTIMDDLVDIAEGCPACCLTLIRQLSPLLPIVGPSLPYNYKEEVASWWKERTAENAPDYGDIY